VIKKIFPDDENFIQKIDQIKEVTIQKFKRGIRSSSITSGMETKLKTTSLITPTTINSSKSNAFLTEKQTVLSEKMNTNTYENTRSKFKT